MSANMIVLVITLKDNCGSLSFFSTQKNGIAAPWVEMGKGKGGW